jgi:CHAT domain-containing protein
LSGARSNWRGRYQNQWHHHTLSGALLALLIFCGNCDRNKRHDPQLAYRQVQLTFLQGDLAKATQQSEEEYQRYLGKDREWAWQFRLLEAKILAYRRLSKEALAMLNFQLPADLSQGDLAIRKEMVEGLALARLGRSDADPHLNEAQRLCELTHSPLAGELADINGVVATGRENFPVAEAFFRRSLQAARQQQDKLLETIAQVNLGYVALRQQHYDDSILWSTGAYRAADKLGAHFVEQAVLGNLGWAYYRMGDTDKSLFFFQQAADEARKLGTNNDLEKWIRALGLVSQDMNQSAVAEDYYKQALTLAQQSEDKEELADVLRDLAAISVEQQKWEQAIHYDQQAITLCRSDGDRAGELDALLVEGQIAAHQNDAAGADRLFREVAAAPESEVPLKWEAQENLARLYEDENRPSDAVRQYKLSLATLENSRSSLRQEELRLPFLANAAHLQDDYIHFLVTQGASAEALQVADYSRAQTLSEGLDSMNKSSISRPAAIETPQKLDEHTDATILFYWLGPKYSYLWVVTRNQISLFPLPSIAVIDALVQSYRKELQGPRDVLRSANQNGIDLYNILVAPARREIAEHSPTIIVPDGTLNNLNFETLLVPGNKSHYLIEDATIINAGSLRLLRASSRIRASGSKLLLIGDPISPNHEYADLPDAAVEIQSIEKHFAPSDRTVFTGAAATSYSYLNSSLDRFSYIHFVAHATASRLSPLESAVILSKVGLDDDSFKLYARDIVRRPVQADLVTISTCYGAGARAYTGEGLVGLSWAFLRAGAHNVIAALWQASDSATPQLMDRLYEELAAGHSPDVALRTAKLALLHSDSVFRKPFYWAPFQLYSNQVEHNRAPAAGELFSLTRSHWYSVR